ncbi:LCP family protein [Cellulomonas wangsupingiae]|uniref:LCP family protein n=1 Tax=Cellulomonas wangsupingiae TaxID=2968085 RepID=A0ABY5K6Q2_9CELL|nr:LCP family protein [Cellulomonas wangsupingiae]MCC2336101.1 LCP family protein [Cellulomonas wangsupingiae]MCM0639587.1 LCP family protein [Cellulomonas wangsupingiae]UUI64822.1 LCP family protein [Cellulomonas wangsupingiae]
MPDAPRPGPRHARVPVTAPRGPVLVLTAVVVTLASAAAAVYVDLRSQLDVSDAAGLVLATPAPVATTRAPDDPFAGAAMNVLVMGTDLRDEENAALAGDAEGMRSDSTMLVHVAGDRTWAEVVSIPRDSLVEVPECLLPDGGVTRARRTMFNEAFSIGAGPQGDPDHAAACTIGTVQSLTGVTVTHHVVVRMTGVIDVVDALGGVRMCLPEPVDEDPDYGDLHLPAGEQRLDGRQAIGFLRARHGTGMGLELGSDLTRITRQQAFVQAAVRELLAKDLLGDADQLYDVARAVLGSLRADPQLADPVRLAAFGYSLRGMDRARVVFTGVPVAAAASDPNRVEWTSAADEIWQRLASDTPPPSLAPQPGAGTQTGAEAGTEAGGGEPDATPDAAVPPDVTPPPDSGTGADPLGAELLPGVCAT